MLIKICGLTREEDALAAVRLGATHLGFIFAPSVRRVTPLKAARILKSVERAGWRGRVNAVGVFVNEEPGVVQSTVTAAGLDMVQLHGDETGEYATELGVIWYRAIRADDPVAGAAEARRWTSPGGLLLADALVRGVYGGTGQRLAVKTACAIQDAVHASGGRFFLAGGLGPETIQDAIRTIRPDGVDLSSGLESGPGIKSEKKMRAFFSALREMEASDA